MGTDRPGASMPSAAVELTEWIGSAGLDALAVGPGTPGRSRYVGGAPDLYGTCDAVGVLATLGRAPTGRERDAWVDHIRSYQDATTGHFVEGGPATHVPWHVTAYATAALRSLDAEPAHPVGAAAPLATPPAIRSAMEELNWREWVYLESHTGAGIGATFANVGALAVPEAWWDAYFSVLDARLDPRNGMHGVGKPPGGDLDQVGATFHYAFLYEHRGRLLAHRDARVDAVLRLQRADGLWDPDNPWWLTLDAIHLLRGALDDPVHRAAEARAATRAAVDAVLHRWAPVRRDDLVASSPMASHDLMAVVTVLAEAADLLGWPIPHRRPVPVLRSRPFV